MDSSGWPEPGNRSEPTAGGPQADQPTWQLMDVNVLLTVVYLCIFLIGVVGNLCNCLVIADPRNRYMKTATNYYLFSLSVSDLLLLTFGLPHDIINLWHPSPYLFNQFVCISRGWISEASTYASVLVIVAFTVERYLAICHPLKAHTLSRLSRCVKMIVLIWVVASTCALAVVMQYGVIMIDEKRPDGQVVSTAQCTTLSKSETIFELSVLVFFIIPMAVITILYLRLGYHLRHKSSIIKQSQLERQKRLHSVELEQNSAISYNQEETSQNAVPLAGEASQWALPSAGNCDGRLGWLAFGRRRRRLRGQPAGAAMITSDNKSSVANDIPSIAVASGDQRDGQAEPKSAPMEAPNDLAARPETSPLSGASSGTSQSSASRRAPADADRQQEQVTAAKPARCRPSSGSPVGSAPEPWAAGETSQPSDPSSGRPRAAVSYAALDGPAASSLSAAGPPSKQSSAPSLLVPSKQPLNFENNKRASQHRKPLALNCTVNAASMRSVIKMLVSVVVMFFICWAPFHAQRLMAVYVVEPTSQQEYIYSLLNHISGISYYISAVVNPILYSLFSVKFRQAFRDTFGASLGLGGGKTRARR